MEALHTGFECPVYGEKVPENVELVKNRDGRITQLPKGEMPRKLAEHTYGGHIFMRVLIDANPLPEIHEIDVYIKEPGHERYYTTADKDPEKRQKIIDAFDMLY